METRLKTFTKFINDSIEISESLKYHASNNFSITESVFRPGSDAHIKLLSETRELFENKQIILETVESWLFENTDLGKVAIFDGITVPLDLPLELFEIHEDSKKSPKLGKPMRGGPKKYHVYVRNPETGKIKRIVFGDVHGGLTAKVSNPKARKSFAARHKCKEKKDRLTAGYWACRINRYAHLWGGKTYPGFW